MSERKPIAWLRPLLTIAAIYVAPVLVVLFGGIPFQWRFQMLVAMTAVGALVAASREYTLSRLGMRRPRLSGLLKWSILPSVLLIGGLLLSDLPHRLFTTASLPFYFVVVLISSPAQEFLYRSFLHAELSAAGVSSFGIVVISAGLYGFMHVIYGDYLTVALTFAVGIVWSLVFARTRSFPVVAVSHAALGAVAIALGVI